MADTKRDKSGRWEKGQSPNPAGRPKGSGLSAKLRRAIEQDADAILQAVIEQAKAGDVQAARILLDRVCPSLKSESQPVQVPGLSGGASLAEKAASVLDAAAMGELAPDIAAGLVAAVGQLARVTEVDELEKRLARIERQQEGRL